MNFKNSLQDIKQAQVQGNQKTKEAPTIYKRKMLQLQSEKLDAIENDDYDEKVFQTVYKYMGKVVCVNYDQQERNYFKYSTGCFIGGNLIIVPANALFSQKTNQIYNEIYFFFNRQLESEFDFYSQFRIRVINYYINPKFFNEMDQRGEKEYKCSVYDVAICELDGEDIRRTVLQDGSKIAFDMSYDLKNSEPEQLLICKYSQHQQNKRHLLQAAKSAITKKSKHQRLINYKYKPQKQEYMKKHEDALIFSKVKKDGYFQYYLCGIHKGNLQEESYGFLLNDFFERDRVMAYQITKNDKIDFHQKANIMFNDLLNIMLTNKTLHMEKVKSLNFEINKQNELLAQKEEQLLRMTDHFAQQTSLLRKEITRLSASLEYTGGGAIINKQALQMKNKKIEDLMSEKERLRNSQEQLRLTIQSLKSKIINLQLHVEEEKQKSDKFYDLQQKFQYEKATLSMTVQSLNRLSKLDQEKSLQVNKELKVKQQEIKQLRRELIESNGSNKSLEQLVKKLQRQGVQYITMIDELCKQNQELKLLMERELNQLRNPHTISNAESLFNRLLRNDSSELRKEEQKQIIIPVREKDGQKGQCQIFDMVHQQTIHTQKKRQQPNQHEHQQFQEVPKEQISSSIIKIKNSSLSRQQSQSSCISNSSTIIVGNVSILQQINSINEKIEQNYIDDEQQKNCCLFKSIFSIFSRKTSINTRLEKKIFEIKQLYSEEIKAKYKLQKPIKYLEKVYNNRSHIIQQKYYENTKQRIINAKQQHQVTLTIKGYSLYLEDIKWKHDFFNYNWLNLEFLKVVGCNICSKDWNEFCLKAQTFLPNIKALCIELEDQVEVKEEQLLNFWSIEKIWFEGKGNFELKKDNYPNFSNESKDEIKRFIKNKMENHSIPVQVVMIKRKNPKFSV